MFSHAWYSYCALAVRADTFSESDIFDTGPAIGPRGVVGAFFQVLVPTRRYRTYHEQWSPEPHDPTKRSCAE
jgi:hypothetical protein